MMNVHETDFIGDSSESGISSNGSSSSADPVNELGPATWHFTDVGFPSPKGAGRFQLSDIHTDLGKPTKLHGKEDDFKNLAITCGAHMQELRFFCIKCGTKICMGCILREHGFCSFKPLYSYGRKLWESVFEEDKCDFRALKANIMNTEKVFKLRVNSVRKEIDNYINQIQVKLEEERKNLFGKLHYIEKLKTNSWKGQIALCDRALKKLNSYRKYLRTDLRDLNALRKSILTDIGGELDFIEDEKVLFLPECFPPFSAGKIWTSATPKNCVVVVPNTSILRAFNYCTVTIKNHLDEEVRDCEYSLTATLYDTNHNLVNLIIENLENGKFKIIYYPESEGRHLLHLYLNSVPLVKSPYEIQVGTYFKDATDSSVTIGGGTLDEEAVRRPWGVCTDYEGKIYVVDRGHNCVKSYNEDGSFITSFGREGSGPGELRKPTGIAIDRALRRIIIADKDNHRIQIFTYEGSYISHFGEQGVKDGQLLYPWDVAVSHAGLIAVSDSRNRRVQLFDERGQFLRKFSFHVRGVKELELPRGVAFKSDGSLLVTDFNKHQIVLLDESFESAKRFGSEGSDLCQFFRPQSIDVDQEGRFAVADCKNHRVQIFLPCGKLYAMVGTKGNAPGQLDSPQGLCFLPDGRIVVAELGNNRVQILKVPNENED